MYGHGYIATKVLVPLALLLARVRSKQNISLALSSRVVILDLAIMKGTEMVKFTFKASTMSAYFRSHFEL